MHNKNKKMKIILTNIGDCPIFELALSHTQHKNKFKGNMKRRGKHEKEELKKHR